jgi:hypothetical protein
VKPVLATDRWPYTQTHKIKAEKSRDRCYDFKNTFAKKLAFFTQNTAKLFTNWIITLVFKKKRQFLSQKLGKIA